MAKAVSLGLVPNTCGIGFSSMFRANNYPGGNGNGGRIKDISNMGGAGWHIAGFTPESPAYKEAYEELKDKWKIVYQSPVRLNTRSGNQFFMVVYDTRSRGFRRNNKEYEWPL